MMRFLKWLAVVLLLWALYRHFQEAACGSFWESIAAAWQERRSLLLAAAVLMPVNWGLEVLKWRVLMEHEGQYPALGRSFRAVMTGLSLSVFTPARAGDYLGRSLQAGPFGKWRAVRATFLGYLLQWLLMLALGLPAWCLLKNLLPLSRAGVPALWAFSLLLAAALFLSLPRWPVRSSLSFLVEKTDARLRDEVPRAKRFGESLKNKFFLRMMAFGESLKKTPLPSVQHLAKALGWGSGRYLVYSLQLLLLLRFFGLETGVMDGLAGIWLIFLLQSGLPLPGFIGSTVLRTELAFWVWPAPDPAAVLAGMTALFVLNLGLPALLGAVFLVKIKEHQQ